MEKTYPRFDLPDDIKSGPAKYIQMSDITRSVLVKNADSLESGLLRPRHGKVTRLGAGAVEGVAQAVFSRHHEIVLIKEQIEQQQDADEHERDEADG